ncbi:hypothetical protein BpHYR1_051345 [Brachionus plicatilis]|uniref:Uncharacterized protein n=1 Tax=Brachionus plicatilis TaxID=10195 RepID=A0A3M7P954_BRAPC|nr:hypothetical protein BpHYR1_051345 [Brachionus plicatilis]
MSLTIRIRSLYQENSISLSKSILSNANDKSLIQNLNLIPASKYSLIECRLKIYFISSNGKRINLTKQNVNEPSDSNRIMFKIDNKPIRFGDRLEIFCFKSNKFSLKVKEKEIKNNKKIHLSSYLEFSFPNFIDELIHYRFFSDLIEFKIHTFKELIIFSNKNIFLNTI